VDDGIFLGSNNLQLQDIIKEIQNLGLNIEDEGHPADYVSVNIKTLKDGSFEFTQQALIASIIDDTGLKASKVKPVPAKVALQLHAFRDEPLYVLEMSVQIRWQKRFAHRDWKH
jgi:hypothetical protein